MATMQDYSKIETLLEKYYDGASSPEEELILHLALLDLPMEDPLRRELAVLEGLMSTALATPQGKKRWRLKVTRRATGIASVAAAGVLLFWGISRYQHQAGQSYINGEPIAQEEVNRQAQMAFRTLAENLNSGLEAREKAVLQLSATNESLESLWHEATDTYEEEAVPFVLDY